MGHHDKNQCGVGQRGQVDPDHPVREAIGHVFDNGERQYGPANPDGSGQRQEGNGFVEQQIAGRGALCRPADEPRTGMGSGWNREDGATTAMRCFSSGPGPSEAISS